MEVRTRGDALPLDAGTEATLARRPRLVYWETTRACWLTCHHCRARAHPRPHPRELDADEGLALLDGIAAIDGDGAGAAPPHLVLTGGDPLERIDLLLLIEEARARGIPVSVTPAGTTALTDGVVRDLDAAGVAGLGLSLDGATPAGHDGLRGEPGSFDRTLAAARAAKSEGLGLQINTLVAADTVDDLPGIHDLVVDLGADRWALFFLVRTGRGRRLRSVPARRAERVLGWVCGLNEQAGAPIVKTTEAHHVRRILHARLTARGWTDDEVLAHPAARGFGIRDGCGVVFVSHTGQIYPSGFLPIPAGNVRRDDLGRVYREAALFRALRDPGGFSGPCGRCEYRRLCGGSRARALAETGDPLGSDPLCVYEP